MKFTCDLKKLKIIANNVSFAVSLKNATIASLEGILLECKNNKLKLTGYNLSLGIVKSLDVKQQKEGKIILKAQVFVDILKKLTEETVEISTNENLITTIKTKTTEFKLPGIKAELYPQLPEFKDENKIEVKDKILKNGIFKTLYAVSLVETQNPTLCGSLFKISKNLLTIVSVDGYRVAISNVKIENLNFKCEFVVSSKTLNEIFKLLSDDENKKTTISIGKTHAVFLINEYYIITRLLQGEFLDYNAAIPKECKTNILINPQELENSLEKVSVIITQKISVLMEIKENKIILSSKSTIGKAKDSISTTVKGENLEKIAFNNRFMLDALKHCQTEKILIGFNGPVMPIILKPVKGEDFLFLVLPVRL